VGFTLRPCPPFVNGSRSEGGGGRVADSVEEVLSWDAGTGELRLV
jgi:hypothetical protein